MKLTLDFATYRMLTAQAYQSSQYVAPRGGISIGKWRSSFAGNSDVKMNVQSACSMNTRYMAKEMWEDRGRDGKSHICEEKEEAEYEGGWGGELRSAESVEN
jgi:hypothetical protein